MKMLVIVLMLEFIKEIVMDRLFTYMAVDEGGYVIRKFLSKREAEFFCSNKDEYVVKSTGVKKKVVSERDLYKKAFLEVGECLF